MENSKIYSFNVKTIEGNPISLSDFTNKVLLIVNVASQCGFTSQYEDLEKLYQHYKGQGFEVLGFPCNQFGMQEPGSEEDIKQFCSLKYNVTFPLFSKIEVNGSYTHPLYDYMKKEAKGIFNTGIIKWNFTKFLIDKNGKVVNRFPPQTTPLKLKKDIEALL